MLSLKLVRSFFFIIGFSSLLAACSLVGTEPPPIPCPIEDESYCDFVRELEPLIVAQDVNGMLANVDLRCCSGDFLYPFATPEPNFNPDEECVLTGAILGEGSCTPISDFVIRWEEDAPFQIRYILISEKVVFLSGNLVKDPILILASSDDEWDLAFTTKKDAGNWVITAILGIRKEFLSQFPLDSLIPWPPGTPPLIIPPYVTPKG